MCLKLSGARDPLTGESVHYPYDSTPLPYNISKGPKIDSASATLRIPGEGGFQLELPNTLYLKGKKGMLKDYTLFLSGVLDPWTGRYVHQPYTKPQYSIGRRASLILSRRQQAIYARASGGMVNWM